MGDLGITINDLGACPACTFNNPMIFQREKSQKWWVSCGHRRCEHTTKEHIELLDAADEWGLKASE